MLVRPICATDAKDFIDMILSMQASLTSLPKDPEVLQKKIEYSIACFKENKTQNALYLFVLRNKHNELIGCSAIYANEPEEERYFSYRKISEVKTSTDTHFTKNQEILFLNSDHQNCSSLGSLYLKPNHRNYDNARLLSYARFLYMFAYRHKFNDEVITQIRGVCDEKGISPFWDSLGRHFFGMDFKQADHLCGLGKKQFILDLMPRHPIYYDLLSPSARAVIGKAHDTAQAAYILLAKQGFSYDDYFDIFDAGPLLSAAIEDIKLVKKCKNLKLSIQEIQDGQKCFIARLEPFFQVSFAKAWLKEEEFALDANQASYLQLEAGQTIFAATI